MSIHEWIERGSLSERFAEKRGIKELVRCKDCKYRFENLRCYANNPMVGRLVGGDWFCADGERRVKQNDK